VSSGATTPLVLVHGGAHGAWCWEPMLPLLATPDVLAVDLPPVAVRTQATRFSEPPALLELTIDDFASATLAAADARGYERFVLVGHSLAGLTLAAVAARAPERVARLVFVSATVPPEGGCVFDALPPELRDMSREAFDQSMDARSFDLGRALPEPLLREMFCNDMDETQTQFVLDHVGNEVIGVLGEPVSRTGIPADLPKTYVKLRRDQSLPPALQDELIANLRTSPGGDVDVVELDSGHDVMVSNPQLLAPVLDRLAGASS
jgi:pimeloyl-ACP methyl ester carboxylesterase